MSIESIMYFALGALAATLVMLTIMPAIWRRAVRLTKKRIEAATPITLAEFRADKDQLRAEFALSTRRLEMQVDNLRKRLSEQLGDASQKKTDLALLQGEREQFVAAVAELEAREQALQARLAELERDGQELAQQLEARSHELEQKAQELGAAREAVRQTVPTSIRAEGKALTGDYDEDIDELLTAVAVERKRARFFESEAKALLERLDTAGTPVSESEREATAVAELRRTFIAEADERDGDDGLAAAEVHIAEAESRLSALLDTAGDDAAGDAAPRPRLLAEKLSADAQLEQLREKVLSVEAKVLADWDTERADPDGLRDRLGDIASEVSRLVYAVDGRDAADPEESLFDRVQRFADDGVKVESFPVRNGMARAGNGATPHGAGRPGGNVSDRMAALRELQGRR